MRIDDQCGLLKCTAFQNQVLMYLHPSSIDDTVGESDSSPDVDNAFKRGIFNSTANQDMYPAYQTGFINPFKPYHLSYKLTLFRHLWLHTFPTDPTGEAVQEHHRKILMDQDGISPSVSKTVLCVA